MVKDYNNYVNNNINYGNIRKNYKKVLKHIENKPEFLYKLDININYYYNIFNNLFNNSDINIENYDKMLLIIYSIFKFMDDNNDNVKILEELIVNNKLKEYQIMSYNSVMVIYQILLIIKKSLKNKILIFESKIYLIMIFNYINENNISISEFNNIFEDNNSNHLLNFLVSN